MSVSPELTAGTGFTFESNVSAIYLASLLLESTAPGLDGRIVQRVSLQQAPDEPLDDLIVDFKCHNDETGKLSLQIKRSLKISAANTDFREIIVNSWKTLKKGNFEQEVKLYGFVTEQVVLYQL